MSMLEPLSLSYPEVARLWDFSQNGDRSPETTPTSSAMTVWWKCEEGHSWQGQPRNVVLSDSPCPYCSGRKPWAGKTDFGTTHPEAARLWHPTKNDDLSPDQFFAGSNQRVWWQCLLGHEWETTICSVALQGSGCGYCSGRNILVGFNDLATINPAAAKKWHPTKNGDLTPSQVSVGSTKKVWWQCEKSHEWETTIASVSRMGTGCPYCSGKRILAGFNDLATTHPEVAAQWHPTKNGDLTPEQVGRGSSRKAWWVCSNRHEREAVIANVAGGKSGCMACSGRALIPGVNDLLTTHPLIAKKWHPIKNGNLTPSQVKASSHVKAHWKCDKGHEWSAVIYSQTDTSCPYCYGRYVITGENDLATLYPEAAKEWHPTKNGDLTPDRVMPYTPKKAWWQCALGHEWETSPNSRFVKGYTGCPFCGGKKILTGFNDLATTHPEVAAQWHPTKNGALTPQQIGKVSDTKIWWKCSKDHEWEATISSRTIPSGGAGCAVCSHKRVDVGVTDLLTLNPELARQWHPTKNGDLTADKVAAFSSLKVWWMCNKKHEWEAIISGRHQGRNCARCTSGEKASKTEKELALYVESLGVEVVKHGRKILKGQELDIYVPSKKVAIEFNGIYWHTEKKGNKDKNYHRNKWLACKELGIQLIQVWEDEWNRNPEQVKRMIAHKLGVSSQQKVFARKTRVVQVSKHLAEGFLNEHHVQGYASGSYYVALTSKDSAPVTYEDLLALIVLKNEAGTNGRSLNIIRYATAANVVGGFTKLLTFAERTYKPDSFITFADHCVSDGGLYENNGFVADKELAPDYMYFFNKERHHKFGYRLKRFRDDPNLIWVEGLTERQLADLNGLDRVWDAGKTRYVKHCKHE